MSVDARTRLWRGPRVIKLDTHREARGWVTRAPLVCSSCSEIIPPGSVVTLHCVRRSGARGIGSNPGRPCCWWCQKFVLLGEPEILTLAGHEGACRGSHSA